MEQRLVVISNRLPVSITRHPDTGEWTYRMSSGGLGAFYFIF